MKKIVILGSTNMAGHIISDCIFEGKDYQIYKIDENDFINDFSINIQLIKHIRPNYLINCIRYLVDESEKNPDSAIFINSFLPRYLEKTYLKTSTKIIHLSTDCVFKGDKGNYDENFIPDGTSVYAKTKIMGEIINNKDITIRTSYIGPNLNNVNEELLEWFLNQKDSVYGYKNAIWNGITTLELTRGIEALIGFDYSGIYHMVPESSISKYDLLNLIKKIWNKKIKIKKNYDIKINRTLIDSQKIIELNNYENMFKNLYNYTLQK